MFPRSTALDASEYIRNVKTVIDAVMHFVKNNPEVCETPELIRDVLYNYAKAQWLARLEKTVDPDQVSGTKPDLEYQAYCYDYLYPTATTPVDPKRSSPNADLSSYTQ